MRIGCVLMAAGSGARFGSNKLLAPFRGRPLICRAFAALPREALSEVVVVTGYAEVAALAEGEGCTVICNDRPDLGVSRTVRLGTEALLGSCDGVLYQVADQPLLQKETVLRLLEAFRANPDRIIVPTANSRWGNPCIFPGDLLPALCQLTGDVGGKTVIRANPARVLEVPVPPADLADADTAEALFSMERE